MSSEAISATPRTISAIGQNVMPSPYGRHRPRTTCASRETDDRELPDQPRLADPGVADDRQQGSARASPPRPRECRRQAAHLRLAADERRRLRSSGMRSTSRSADEPIRRDGFCLALQCERRDLLDVDLVASQAVGQVAEDDLAGPCGLLEPRRGIDGVAGDQPLAGRGVAGDHLTGVDADVVVQLEPHCSRNDRLSSGQGRLHVGRRADGADGVVLVTDRAARRRP